MLSEIVMSDIIAADIVSKYIIFANKTCQEPASAHRVRPGRVLVSTRASAYARANVQLWGRQPMKINVEMEMTPEELRRFMGLPDVQGVQQQMLESFTEGITASSDQRDEFLRNVFAGAMAPWQNFFNMVSGMNPPGGSRD